MVSLLGVLIDTLTNSLLCVFFLLSVDTTLTSLFLQELQESWSPHACHRVTDSTE